MPRRAELPNLNPARLDIPHYRGDSLSATFRFQSQGVPIDVSNWTFEAYIRDSPDGAYIAEFTPDMANAIDGIVRMILPFPVARLLPASAVWDLQATTENPTTHVPERVMTLIRGYIYTVADVTYPQSYIDVGV